MTTFSYSAVLSNGLPGSLCDSLQQVPSQTSQPTSRSKTAQKKEDAARALEAAWANRIPLARWLIDLGPLPDSPVPVEATASPEKRQLEDAQVAPSLKRLRLDVSTTGRSYAPRAPRSPLVSLPSNGHVTFTQFQSKETDGEDGTSRPEPGRFVVIFEGYSEAAEELEIVLRLSPDQEELLVSAVELCDVPETSRARTFVSIGRDANSSSLKVMLDFCFKDAQHLTDTLVATKLSSKIRAADLLLSRLYPETRQDVNKDGPRLFYDSVHVPKPRTDDIKAILEVPGLQTGLYPFQKRSLEWMIEREAGPSTASSTKASFSNGFREIRDVNGDSCHYNPWLRLVTTHEEVTRDSVAQLRGGILAEEMGLGKTVELISLIQLHKRDNKELGFCDGLYRTGATLVVAPRTIISQWRTELATHCPGLNVMIYDNLKSNKPSKKKISDDERIQAITSYDVVLCDYLHLQRELHRAVDPPERSRRAERQYERPRSLLTQIDWWRVILDEAQSIETPTTSAARVVVQIPRQNAWAVTGTPLKRDPADLYGLFLFLGLEPYALSFALFNSMIKKYSFIFKDLIGRVALRHTKDLVKTELQLPAQKRIALTVPFTAIEESNYTELFETMASECGLNLDGSPAIENWRPDDPGVISSMREWLVKLRKVCLHPEVGARFKQARNGREAPLRTVEEVLAAMLDFNDNILRTEERLRLQSMLLRGQILEQAGQPANSLRVWQEVLNELRPMVASDRSALSAELIKTKSDEVATATDEAESDDPNTRMSTLRNRLRVVLELQHSTIFFIANACFQLKTDQKLTAPDSDRFRQLEKEETDGYEEAKLLRRELLASSSEHAHTVLDKVRSKIKANALIKLKGLRQLPRVGGIEAVKHIQAIEDIADTLNQQAELFDELREKLCKAVLSPLVDQEDTELTGEEYEQSTQAEDNIHAYMEALRLIIADRAQLITGQRNMNVRREASQIYKRALAGEGHTPQLMKELLSQVNKIRPSETGLDQELEIVLSRSMLQLKQLHDTLDGRAGRSAEVATISQVLQHLRPQQADEVGTITALEKELEMFSDAVNARVEYYRQLQIISDSVAPCEENLNEQQREIRLRNMSVAETKFSAKISRLRSRATFLQHLKASPNADAEERICPICTDRYENGILTSCGHRYCQSCIQYWWGSHRNCPQCKQTLGKRDLHPITYKPIQLSVQEDTQTRSPSADAASGAQEEVGEVGIYTGIDTRSLDEIKLIDLPKSYGTKIDMLARHLIWLRQKEPGAKSVIFSQFSEFFSVLQDAFDRFKIGWASLNTTTTASAESVRLFKTERKVEVLFLHAKAQAAGLNLINATHVFLCEPLLNTAIELQAIARVHRIGQHHVTTIWQYLVENSVEKAIYDISVDRRLAHIQSSPGRTKRDHKRSVRDKSTNSTGSKTLEDDIDAANSLEIEAPVADLLAKGREGEQVAKEDLWPCLFKYRPRVPTTVQDDAVERAATAYMAGEAAEDRRQQAAAEGHSSST